MSLHRRNPRRDKNESAIIEALVMAGASYLRISAAGGSDLIVSFRGVNYLLEVKSSKGKLTAMQEEFMLYWDGPYDIVRTVDDALRAIGAIDE